MKKTIKGNKYDFFIYRNKFRNLYYFCIEALHKPTKVHSCINDVNCILSMLDVDMYGNRFWESEWFITSKESNYFFRKANSALKDKSFASYVEGQLDIDRSLGEWGKT